MLETAKKFYEKWYKVLMIIPMILLLLSVSVLLITKAHTGEYIAKDVSLKGGLFITVQDSQPLDLNKVTKDLQSNLGTSVNIKELSAVGTGGIIGYTFEVASNDIKSVEAAITQETGLQFIAGQYTVEETSASLSASFWASTIKAILLAFVFMAIVVFLYFRMLIPGAIVVLAAGSTLLGTLAWINILGIKLSTAGVAALLMLIGYSVDSDILLSTKMLRRVGESTMMESIFASIKTGLTMQGATIIALVVMLLFAPVEVLKKIALVLLIGMAFDIINTWLQNAGLLGMYLEHKEKKASGEKFSFKKLFAKRQKPEASEEKTEVKNE